MQTCSPSQMLGYLPSLLIMLCVMAEPCVPVGEHKFNDPQAKGPWPTTEGESFPFDLIHPCPQPAGGMTLAVRVTATGSTVPTRYHVGALSQHP